MKVIGWLREHPVIPSQSAESPRIASARKQRSARRKKLLQYSRPSPKIIVSDLEEFHAEEPGARPEKRSIVSVNGTDITEPAYTALTKQKVA